jgi:Lon protease-like protein
MPLALRVFEERYLKMMGALLDHETPHFGVVLIERGSEVGGGEQRFVYGTLAQILQVEAPDGPLAVVARGAERFRVIEWLPDDPYPQARVEILESFDTGTVSDDDIAATERLVRDTLSSAAELGADVTWPSDLELSEDPVEKAWQLAGISPLGPLDHYDFLASDNLEALLTTVRDTVREALETFRMTRNQGESS